MKLKYFCLTVVAACSLVACDLDTAPSTSLETTAVFKSVKDADKVMKGVWGSIFNTGATYASIGLGAMMANDDFAGSDVVRKSPSYAFSSGYSLTDGYSRGECNDVFWDIIYPNINGCNNVIKNIDHVAGDEVERNRVKAQALATRGYLYLLLASNYSFAIDKDPNAVCAPIYLEPTASVEMGLSGQPASSVSEVYQQSLNDLNNALDLMPEDYSHGGNLIDQYKIDYRVILGLLARANLYARHWNEAYNYADKALKKNDYLMNEEEYKSGFSDASNKEWMWGYSSTTDDNLPSYLFHFKDTSTDGSYYYSFYADPHFKDLFTDGDYRKSMMSWSTTPGQPVTEKTKEVYMSYSKFRFKSSPSDMLADLVLMRNSEMYLIKSEAAARLNNDPEALIVLKKLMSARGDKSEVTQTGEELIKKIWIERRKELWGEGFSLVDIIRNQQKVERKLYEGNIQVGNASIRCKGHSVLKAADGSEFTANSKFYLHRIPEQEELQNKNLYAKYPRLSIYD